MRRSGTRSSSPESSLTVSLVGGARDGPRLQPWEFPGKGIQRSVTGFVDRGEVAQDKDHHVKLDQFRATSISGNDITSSCLYVSGLCAYSAGKFAPLCLLIVAFILYLYRAIYGEVVTALPVNGGAYNVLLNTTSKPVASLAACLTLLSYVATCVVSGTDACIYFNQMIPQVSVELATVVVLFVFAVLVWWGITDSANVALAMFVAHLLTMLVLCVYCVIYWVHHPHILAENWASDVPNITAGSQLIMRGSIFTAIYFGTSSALLGISGFETSANFVEEQAEGVFVKTLRNMWVAVSFFNPVLSFLSLAVVPMDVIYQNQGALLAQMGLISGGTFLQYWVCIDATIVLAGAVLTSYVGVTGLVRRMAMDRVLPQTLLVTNKFRGTNHFIIFGFFIIATSLFLLLNGNVDTLSGVYNLAFLCVMSLFAIGCLILKWKRPLIPRDVHAKTPLIFLALFLIGAGLLGNVLRDPLVVQYFVLYFFCTLLVVVTMFQRLRILRLGLALTQALLRDFSRLSQRIIASLTKRISEVNAMPIVFFVKHGDLALMNKAVLYVRDNEQTHRLCMVHVTEDLASVPPMMRRNVQLLDSIYPKIRIDLVVVQGKFGPGVIDWLSVKLGTPKNMMFISCPDDRFAHRIDALGGVRVITNEYTPRGPVAQGTEVELQSEDARVATEELDPYEQTMAEGRPLDDAALFSPEDPDDKPTV